MSHPTSRAATRAAIAVASVCTLIATPLSATAAETKPSPGRALAQRQGCLGCHAVDAQLVGPSYKAVEERFRDQPAAANELAQYIRAGSSGRWGAMAMPPQAQLSEADARRLAAWILSGAK